MPNTLPHTKKSNIILIGMPGVGKSTIGVLLAKWMSKRFVDTDLVIQHKQKMTLQNILDRFGYLRLREMEKESICLLRVRNTVIATGGSAVYSAKAMEHLGRNGRIIYLKLGITEVRSRISNFSTRGIAKPPPQTFRSLFGERTQLYRRYADAVVDCASKSHEAVLAEVVRIGLAPVGY